ncbi:histidinol dehydrogenase, partial [Rhodobacteraceae bacterium KMM 6894]|nr:histidinol dehydrogenase [Rhodobacteraceae bacterium KMM 6894]
CWQEKRPIQKVGLYIPGGTAPLFSTILMLAVPATIAGCKEVVLCTPPNKEGKINPAILYTASLCGVTQIFKVGGIQAIAGMTFGTESIPKVYKIFGPGNQYVT